MYVSLNTWPFDSEMLVRLNFNPSFQILTSNFYQMIFLINTVILNVNLLIRNLSMSVCNFVLYSSPPRYLHLYTLLSTKQFSFVFRMFSRSTEKEGKFKTTFFAAQSVIHDWSFFFKIDRVNSLHDSAAKSAECLVFD